MVLWYIHQYLTNVVHYLRDTHIFTEHILHVLINRHMKVASNVKSADISIFMLSSISLIRFSMKTLMLLFIELHSPADTDSIARFIYCTLCQCSKYSELVG